MAAHVTNASDLIPCAIHTPSSVRISCTSLLVRYSHHGLPLRDHCLISLARGGGVQHYFHQPPGLPLVTKALLALGLQKARHDVAADMNGN